MRGIILLAIGKPEYGNMAFNMALTIRKHSPELPIKLVYEPETLSHLNGEQKKFFDIMQAVDLKDCYSPKIDPGRAKLNIHKYLEWDHNIYLDVDGACLKSLEALFDECVSTGEYFLTQYLTHIEGCKEEFKEMMWAYPIQIWEKYGLKEDACLPATNSSFMYMKRGKEIESFFSKCIENMNNPIEKLRLTWGASQPDELYLNITMAQLGILGKLKKDYPIYFSNRSITRDINEIDRYYILGLFGGKGFSHLSLIEHYDRIINKDSIELTGQNIQFKMKKMINAKHANFRK
jgi:hypothetical protein